MWLKILKIISPKIALSIDDLVMRKGCNNPIVVYWGFFYVVHSVVSIGGVNTNKYYSYNKSGDFSQYTNLSSNVQPNKPMQFPFKISMHSVLKLTLKYSLT